MNKKTRGSTAKHIFTVLILTALCIGSIVYFFYRDKDGKRTRSGPEAAVGVATVPVQFKDLIETKVFTGSLEAENKYDAAAKVGGRIREIAVNLGDCISRGALIARLDSEEFEQQRAQAKAELDVARASLEEAKSRLAAAERNYRRASQLREQKVSSVADLEAAETERLTHQANVTLVQAQIKQREAALRTAEIRASYTTITADWNDDFHSGCRYVSKKLVDEGDTISANAPVVSLVDLSSLKAVINVAEREYGLISKDQAAKISVDMQDQRLFDGRVLRMAPVFDEASRQARVEIGVPNPGHVLKAGMFVRVHIELGRADHAIAVPISAIIKRSGMTGVFVVDDGSARFKKVKTGIEGNGWIQVEGVQSGQQVVTLGHHLLSDGVAVSVSSGKEPEPPDPKQGSTGQ